MIFASVDTDWANIETWNRWYDMEHLPPNIALDGIMTGRRYVAPEELHAVRLPADPLPGFAGGRGVNVTIYLTCADPVAVIGAMTEYREVLEAQGRMDGAGRRVVRAGDAMVLRWVHGDPALRLAPDDIPHVGHTGIRVVLRRGGVEGIHPVAEAAVTVEGVHAVASFDAQFQQGLHCDLYFLEGDSAGRTHALRNAAPYPDAVEVVLDAPFDLVVPFDYAFADRIRNTTLPESID